MTANQSVCALCFEAADHVHHLSGRNPQRDRLDPDLVVGLCVNHHVLVHNLLRSQRVDVPGREPWTPVQSVAFRLLRLAVFIGLYADYHDDPLWPLLATALRCWAVELLTTQPQEGTST